jgi:hypothetical protein
VVLNLITNGGFDSTIGSWSENAGAVLDFEGSDGSPAAGSLSVTNPVGSGSQFSSAVQCVDVDDAANHTVTAEFFMASGQSTFLQYAQLRVRYFSDTGCVTPIAFVAETSANRAAYSLAINQDAWRGLTAAVPSGASSIQVQLVTRKSNAAGFDTESATVLFDSVSLTED